MDAVLTRPTPLTPEHQGFGVLAGLTLAKIRAGGKMFAGAGEDNDTRHCVLSKTKRSVLYLLDVARVQRIGPLWSVEGYNGDLTATFDFNMLVVHRRHSPFL